MNNTTHDVVDAGGTVTVKNGAGGDQSVGTAEKLKKAAEQGRLSQRLVVNHS